MATTAEVSRSAEPASPLEERARAERPEPQSACASRIVRPQPHPTGSSLRRRWKFWRRRPRRCIWLSCGSFARSSRSALAWAYFGRIDIIASAQGKFQPTGRVKVIEPLETGRVAAIRATNGSPVAEGDVLVELDRSAAEADLGAAKDALASARAEALRRRAALAAANGARLLARRAIDWPDDIAPALREREDRVLAADLGQLAATLASFDAQRAQKTAEREMLLQTIATQKNLVATLQQRVDMRTKLVESQSGAKAAVIDATETLQYQQTQLATQEQQLASLSTGLEVIARDSEKAVETFLSDDAQKLSDAERRVEDARQRLAKAEAVVDHLTLRAPIAGRVQSSVIANVGQVVTSGQEVMRVVPRNSKLEIEAYVLNRDIGFVSVGQEAVVKVEVVPVHPLRLDQGACDPHRQRTRFPRPTPARSRAIPPAPRTRPATPAASARRTWCSRWSSSPTSRRCWSTASSGR